MAISCTLAALHWLGIYYLPSPTVVMAGLNASNGAALAMGATAWTVNDGDGAQVGSGTMLNTAQTVTVASGGSWTGGGAVVPGHYTVFTNSGTNGVVAGAVVICAADSNLYRPAATGDQRFNLSAWIGSANDRDYYAYLGGQVFVPNTAAQIISTRGIDAYFTGPQDPARPRPMRISTADQAPSPTWAPTVTDWQNLATALVGAGYMGVTYEIPTNEPENGGWSITTVCTQFNTVASAIKAIDPTALVIGWDTAGIYAGSTIANLTTFLTSCTPDGFSNHMENSHQNLANIVALRQYIGGVDDAMVAAGTPNMPMHFTETGINGGLYGNLQPRRDARQRTVLRFVMEAYGHPKENCYDFPVFDHVGSSLTSYMVDYDYNGTDTGDKGSLRAGAYAIHVMSEALYGTPCTRTNRPATLSFGQAGWLGTNLFAGLHYSGTSRDVVVLATNGIEAATVTLAVSGYTNGATVTYWDGWGRPGDVTVTNGQITVPVNDLLTYVFLSRSTTVSVVDTDQAVVTQLNKAVNLANNATVITNTGGGNVNGVVNNSSFAENNSGITGIATPYTDTTIPGTLTINFATPQTVSGFALMCLPPWQASGCGILTASLVATVGGVQQTLWSYTCASAVSVAVPSPSFAASADQCTRTSWWTGCFSVAKALPPVVATSVTLSVTASYGGQPDAASATLENVPQVVRIAEYMLFSPYSTVTGPGGSLLARRVGS